MSQSAKDTESVVYSGIGFQGKTGSLLLTAEKLVFRQDTGSDDPSVWTRSWLWASIKKIRSSPVKSVNDDTSIKYALKICNYSNKAVSFQALESEVVHKLQKEMNTRMAEAKDTPKSPQNKEQSPEKTMEKPISADDTVHRALKLAHAYKAANANTQDDSSVSTVEVVTTTVVTTVTTTETTSTASTSLETANDNTEICEDPILCSKKPASTKPKKTLSNSVREASTKPSATARGAPMRSSNPERGPKKVSLMHATKVITQDLFIKPSQQMAHDLVVRPTNNLIVKPVRHNIIDPAQEKIVKPVQQKLTVTRPEEEEKNVGPEKQAAQKTRMSPKMLAQDIGILPPGRGSRPETIDESESSNTLDGSGSSRRAYSKKKPLLYFLKAPPRRTFSEDLSPDSFTVPSAEKDDEEPKLEDEEPEPSRKSAGSKLFSKMKNPMKKGLHRSVPVNSN